MARTLVECVPNFSEGRDARTIEAIVNAIAGAPGAMLLGWESDPDHNRSVVTFAGAPQAVAAGAMRGIAKAVELIDLSSHSGVHPRIGAADVVPFVPVEGISIEDCAALAAEVGEEVWRRLRVPVYLYEAAARVEERRRLENIRRGGLAWLREHIAERLPDIGEAELHPTAGAVVIGARKFLIAFNLNLNTDDVGIARSIASRVRESSAGLPAVKALAFPLASRGIAQVSLNLTDFERTGIAEAFGAVMSEAQKHGVAVAATEIVGFVPRRAWVRAAATLLRCGNFRPERILEDRLESISSARSFDEVLEQISNPASPMGGGSAAALTGALGAALGYSVARISKLKCDHFLAHREFFAGTVARDAAAFGAVLTARGAGPEVLEQAYRTAALVPAELTERAKELDRDLLVLKQKAPSRLQPDVTTALGLARAARAGGIAAAKANLQFIGDESFRREIEERLDRRPS
jgi:glutamate formiminotransferase/formiminotetrahydrofolate cyclodeaminase